MTRLTEPKAPNRGKSAWRHLTRDELHTVAKHAKSSGSLKATARHFGIDPHTVRRACKLNGITPTPFKPLDLAAIAKASEGKPRFDAAKALGVSEGTIARARRLHGRAAA